MSEETKPPVTEAPKVVPKQDAAAKLTPQELVKKMRAELELAEKQLQVSDNFGPGKPGKRNLRVPSFPREWKMADIKTVNASGKKVYRQGSVMSFTCDEYEDLVSRFSARVRFERKARGGSAAGMVDMGDTAGGGGAIF